jgi:hypothetical protein
VGAVGEAAHQAWARGPVAEFPNRPPGRPSSTRPTCCAPVSRRRTGCAAKIWGWRLFAHEGATIEEE